MKCFEVDARRHLAKLRRVSFVTTLSTRLSKGHDAELERALALAWSELSARHPGIAEHGGAFADHVAARWPLDVEPLTHVRGLAWPDLALAFLALRGDTSALTELSERLRPIVARVVARGDGPDADELSFALEGKLFDPQDSKLAGYVGGGELEGWLSVMATRTWLNLKRARGREQLTADVEPAAPLQDRVDSPELAYLKELYREQFRAAFERAATSLSPEERNVLSAYYSKRANIDAIAASRGIHRATAARRVSRAREQLLSETRRLLLAELQLPRSDLESVMRLIQSQLHVTLSRLFRED